MQFLVVCIFVIGSIFTCKQFNIASVRTLRERISSKLPKEVLDIPIHQPNSWMREQVGLKLRQFGEQILNHSDVTLKLTADELNTLFGHSTNRSRTEVEIPPSFHIEDCSLIEQSARTSFWARRVYVKYVRAIQFEGCNDGLAETIQQERTAFRGDGTLLDSGRQTIQNRIQNSYLLHRILQFCATDRHRQSLIKSRIRRAEIDGSTIIFSS